MFDAKGSVARANAPVSGFRRLDLRFFGTSAHRLVADDPSALAHGRDIGDYPVIAAVLAPVLDHSAPRQSLLEIAPHVLESFRRHVGMPNQIVRLPQHFLA